MFDHSSSSAALGGATLDAAAVEGWVASLASASSPESDDARLDLIAMLKRLKCAAEGLQAEATVGVDASMRRRAAERGVPVSRRGQGMSSGVALARRVSPHRGQQLVGLATALYSELPRTRAALRDDGSVSGARRSSRARRPASPAPTG